MASHFKIAFLASGKVILKLMNKRVTPLLYRLELQMSSASVGLWGEIAFFQRRFGTQRVNRALATVRHSVSLLCNFTQSAAS